VLVREVMTVFPVFISVDATLRRAAEIISIADVSDLMVVDGDGQFVGVLSEGDVIRAMLPDYDEIAALGGRLDDAFSAFVRKGAELADRPIRPLIITDPITMSPDDNVAMAAAVMIERYIRRLPVVADGRLAGTISRADLCRAVVYYSR
jgi:CBS domain-containing protein